MNQSKILKRKNSCFYVLEVEDKFYECAISILLEADEAAVVRENAAQLLANLAAMSAPCGTVKMVPVNTPLLKKVSEHIPNLRHVFCNHNFLSCRVSH